MDDDCRQPELRTQERGHILRFRIVEICTQRATTRDDVSEFIVEADSASTPGTRFDVSQRSKDSGAFGMHKAYVVIPPLSPGSSIG